MPISSIQNQTNAKKEQEDGQPLRNSQRTKHQTVSPHSFDKETSKRIPNDIAQNNFAAFEQMILVPEPHQYAKPQEIPDRFIQKRRLIVNAVNLHLINDKIR